MDNITLKQHTSAPNFLLRGGEMGVLMREKDWSKTPLGPAENWPQSLKTAVRIILTCRQPMFIWWGKEFINLYNDAYKSVVLGSKHPQALGEPAQEVWREIWPEVGSRAEYVILNNEGTFDEMLLLIMERKGYPEETYYTFSYSPVPDDEDGTGGLICACTEETQRVLAERQLALLKEVAAKTADAWTFDDACILSAKALETNGYDLPFAMIYLVDADKERVWLSATCGIAQDHRAVIETASLDSNQLWPFGEVVKSNHSVLVTDLATKFGELPTGNWQTPPHQAVLMPIAPSGQKGRSGILVVGLNPYRLFDDNYKRFIELVSRQISASLANAQTYEEEKKRAEALAEIDRAKTTFFSNVSHEFRTPITLLLSPIEEALAGAYGPLSAQNREWIELAHRNCLRLLKLVNTLLDFSRLEAGRIKAIYQATDLAGFSSDIASSFRSAIEKAGLTLVVDCPPLPEPVYIDRDMWEKIVLNLLSNAFKFTFTGQITVSLQWKPPYAELTVADTGTGIAETDLPHLFERFHRVLNTKSRSFEGTGIGLALVQELVKLHAGNISVISNIGEGSSFIVQIPAGKNHLDAEHISASENTLPTSLGSMPYIEEALQWLPNIDRSIPIDSSSYQQNSFTNQPDTQHTAKAKILLVEDNADMRDYLARLLTQYWQVETVTNGKEALKAVSERVPDLILSDLMMPEVDGIELLKALRADARTNTIPIILLSARAGEESRVEGLNFGADDYLVKPFSARELIARTNTHLALTRMRKEAAHQVEQADMRIRQIVENISEGFFAINRDWRYSYINQLGAKFAGRPASELVGKAVWELFPQLVGTPVYQNLQQAMNERRASKFDAFSERNDLWLENNVYPTTEGIAIFVRDVTARQLAEQEREQLLKEAKQANKIKDETIATLQKTEQELLRMAAIVESSYDPIISLTLEGIILSWNKSAEKLYGYTEKEICDRHISALFTQEYSSDIPKILMKINRGEPLNNFETTQLVKAGNLIPVELTIFPIKDINGAVANACVIVHDITERKYIERERTKLLNRNNG